MEVTTTGLQNTACGARALDVNTSGSYNAAFGTNALGANTTAEGNTACGYNALLSVTTGVSNVAIGREAGDTIITGADNTYLGRHADASCNSVSYESVVGSNVTGSGGNTTTLRNNVYNTANSSTFSTTSDIRIKKNVVDNTTGLDKINQIRVRNFEYRTISEIVDFENPKAVVIEKEGLQLGVIAQEIQEILPDVVKQNTTGAYSVNPDNITWYLVNAVKELSAEVEQLKSQLNN